ncbi:MAG: GT4 family glycosyltransferase PelF [bacterium]|nr:GT4 family glycosyltransferase PelF [bacterium]
MHVVHGFGLGGMENGLVNLINGVDSNIFDFSICCLSKSGESAKRIKRNDVQIFEFHKKDRHEYFLCMKLSRLFQQERVQIVHTHNWGTLFDGVVGAKIARVPIIIHGEHGLWYEDILQVKKRRLLTQKLIFNFTSQIVTVCEDLKRTLTKLTGIKEEKVICIPNGVEFQRFDVEIDRDSKRREIGLQKNDIVVGIIGSLDPIKDHKTFLSAGVEIIKEFPKARFLIIGDGLLKKELLALSEKIGLSKRVLFLGQRDDIPELLKIMDVFVSSSLREGMSNTILEAMSVGRPVVATKVGGTPEIVEDGKTGFLVCPANPEELAEGIIKVLKNPQQSKDMSRAGQERVREKFSLDKMIIAYENLYKGFR